MGQLVVRLPAAAQGGEGGLPGFLLLPVGEEGADLALGVGEAPGPKVAGGSGGGDEPLGRLLLGGGEEGGGGGDPPLGVVHLVADTGQELTLVGGLGYFGEKFGFGHGVTSPCSAS